MLTTLGSGGHGTRDSFDLSDRRARGPGIWVGSAGATLPAGNHGFSSCFRRVFVDVLWFCSVGTWMNLVWWASGLLALTNENWMQFWKWGIHWIHRKKRPYLALVGDDFLGTQILQLKTNWKRLLWPPCTSICLQIWESQCCPCADRSRTTRCFDLPWLYFLSSNLSTTLALLHTRSPKALEDLWFPGLSVPHLLILRNRRK